MLLILHDHVKACSHGVLSQFCCSSMFKHSPRRVNPTLSQQPCHFICLIPLSLYLSLSIILFWGDPVPTSYCTTCLSPSSSYGSSPSLSSLSLNPTQQVPFFFHFLLSNPIFAFKKNKLRNTFLIFC